MVSQPLTYKQEPPGTAFHHTYLEGEKIKPAEIEALGYRLTARFVVIDLHYKLFELLPLDSARPANKSFLAPNHRRHGVIIRGDFQEHKAAIKALVKPSRLAAIQKKKTAPIPFQAIIQDAPNHVVLEPNPVDADPRQFHVSL